MYLSTAQPRLNNEMASEAYKRASKKSIFTKIREVVGAKEKKEMISYEALREELHVDNQHDVGLQTISISDIVGTVGRNDDFDREFRPVRNVTQDKWENVAHAYYSGKPLPPVELIKVGQMYFVVDGNHRISVMKMNGQDYVDAHVIELDTVEDIRTTGEYRAWLNCEE